MPPSASAKASVPAPAAAEGAAMDAPKAARLRKTPRSASVSLSSASSSTQSSDVEASSPRRCSEHTMPRQALVIDHPGSGTVVHKPDGTVVWEPAPERSAQAAGNTGPGLRPLDALLITASVMGGAAVMVGALTATTAVAGAAASSAPYCLTTSQLAGTVAHSVAGFIAGTAAGAVLGPLIAARHVGAVLLRPALLAVAAHRGIRFARGWRSGVAGLLRKLASPDGARVLEALRAIIAAAARSPKFAKQFNKLRGMEALLQRLAAAAPDCPLLHMIVAAIDELCRDADCRESLVAAGGVPRLVALLRTTSATATATITTAAASSTTTSSSSSPTGPAYSPAVAGAALSALSRLADHSLALEAMRDAGAPERLVALAADALAATPPPAVTATAAAAATAAGAAAAAASKYDRRSMLAPAVHLLQALSLDPAAKASIGAAGGVPLLLDVVARGAEPRSGAHAEAVAALHGAARGCPDNQRALAALPAASEVLRAALAGYGPCWHPAKGDLHALLNVLARLQGVQESGGFVVVQSQAAAGAAAGGSGAGLAAAGPAAARA